MSARGWVIGLACLIGCDGGAGSGGGDAGGGDPDGAGAAFPIALLIDPPSLTLCEGGRLPLAVSGAYYSDDSVGPVPAGEVVWTATPSLSVDAEGMVTMLGGGSGEVTAAIGEVTGTATVTDLTCDYWITIEPAYLEMATGQTAAARAIGNDPWGARSDVTEDMEWSSADPTIAAVGTAGEVTAVGPGVTEITAWDRTYGLSAIVEATVTAAPRPPSCSGADTTWPGDYHVFTAADVDAIAGCTAIAGTLFIQAFDLTDIEGLATLTSAEGLTISYNTALADLDALRNLDLVAGDILIYNNEALVDLSGLGGRAALSADLVIARNAALTSLAGLAGLATIEGSLWIGDNPALESLDGLGGLTRVGGRFDVADNPELVSLAALSSLGEVGDVLAIGAGDSLETLAGLESVTSVGGLSLDGLGVRDLQPLAGLTSVGRLSVRNTALMDLAGLEGIETLRSLQVAENPYLIGVNGLDGLTTITDALSIYHDDMLLDLDGLAALTRVDGSTWIDDNDVLADVSGLGGVTTATAGESDVLSVTYNSSLPTCAAEALRDVWLAAGFTGDVTVTENLGTCP